MHRPTRTRRLSIVAMVSLLAFVVVAGEGVRSFWTLDHWNISRGHWTDEEYITLGRGCVLYYRDMSNLDLASGLPLHVSENVGRFRHVGGILGFDYYNGRNLQGRQRHFMLRIPLWALILLLLIAPVRWLISRPANTPAFPVVTKQP